VQLAGACHRLQLAAQPGDLLLDQPAVDLELGLARAADGAKAAALPLQVGPRPHQAGALVVQPRQLDLQPALVGAGAIGENLQDEAGAVQHLGLPGLLQVALLHRADLAVDHHQLGIVRLHPRADVVDLAAAQQGRRARAVDVDRHAVDHDQAERAGQADGLRQRAFRAAVVA
jgi:hypothetical protein